MDNEITPWMEVFLGQMEAFVELDSPGSLDIRHNELENQLLVAPDVAELVGGEHDRDEVYPFLTVHLSVLIDVFDSTPEIMWHTLHDELWIDGQIHGTDAFVIIRRNPFDDASPARQVVDGNTVREKRHP